MELREDQIKVSQLLKDTIGLLCKNSLQYKFEVCIEGIIGVTVDRKEVFLINLKDSFTDSSYKEPESNAKEATEADGDKQNESDTEHDVGSLNEHSAEESEESDKKPLLSKKAGQKRKATDMDNGSEFATPSFQDMDLGVWPENTSGQESDNEGPAEKKRFEDDNVGNNETCNQDNPEEEEGDKEDSNQSYITGVKAVKLELEDSDDDIVIVKEEIDDSYLQATISASSTPRRRRRQRSSTNTPTVAAGSQSQMAQMAQQPVPVTIMPAPGSFHHPSTTGFGESSQPQSSVIDQKDNLTQHTKLHTDDLHQCHLCPRKYKTEHGLTMHIQEKHQEAAFQCLTCDKKYQTRHGLKMHLKSHEGAFKRLSPKCAQGFNHNSEFVSHMTKHQGEKPFQCEKCEKRFGQASHLNCHKEICGKVEKNFQCPHCSNRFKACRYLKEHIISSHENPNRYRCNICGKKFSHRASLAKHIKKH